MRLIALIGFLLSVLIALGAVYVFRNFQNSPAPPTAEVKSQIVVAAENLRFGQKLLPVNLKLIDWNAEALPAGAFGRLDQIKFSSDGPYMLASIQTGQFLLKSQITSAGQKPGLSSLLSPGTVAVTMQVNTITGVAGFVRPDERVDILLSRKLKTSSYADIVLEDIRVLATDSAIEQNNKGAVPAKSVTFEVTREQAQKLILAQGMGSISLALRNLTGEPYSPASRVSTDQVISGAGLVSNSNREPPAQAVVSADNSAEVPDNVAEPQPNTSGPANASGSSAQPLEVTLTQGPSPVEPEIASRPMVSVRVLRAFSGQSYVVPSQVGP